MSAARKVKLTEDEQAKCLAAMRRDGPQRTAKRWGLADDALLRAANGYAIQRGTRALIEQGLQQEGARTEEGEVRE